MYRQNDAKVIVTYQSVTYDTQDDVITLTLGDPQVEMGFGVQKVWTGYDQDNIPASVTVQLQRRGGEDEPWTKVEDQEDLILSAKNKWKGTFDHVIEEPGSSYRVVELNEDGDAIEDGDTITRAAGAGVHVLRYTEQVHYNVKYFENTGTTTITSTLVSAPYELEVRWDKTVTEKPDSIVVQLQRYNSASGRWEATGQTAVVSESTDWKAYFPDVSWEEGGAGSESALPAPSWSDGVGADQFDPSAFAAGKSKYRLRLLNEKGETIYDDEDTDDPDDSDDAEEATFTRVEPAQPDDLEAGYAGMDQTEPVADEEAGNAGAEQPLEEQSGAEGMMEQPQEDQSGDEEITEQPAGSVVAEQSQKVRSEEEGGNQPQPEGQPGGNGEGQSQDDHSAEHDVIFNPDYQQNGSKTIVLLGDQKVKLVFPVIKEWGNSISTPSSIQVQLQHQSAPGQPWKALQTHNLTGDFYGDWNDRIVVETQKNEGKYRVRELDAQGQVIEEGSTFTLAVNEDGKSMTRSYTASYIADFRGKNQGRTIIQNTASKLNKEKVFTVQKVWEDDVYDQGCASQKRRGHMEDPGRASAYGKRKLERNLCACYHQGR